MLFPQKIITNKPVNKILNSFIENWFSKSNIVNVELKNNYFQQINTIAEKNNCYAISVGYTLFKNSQKVLTDIKQFKKNIKYPILHPLIAMNKEEIIEQIKRIGLEI